MPTVYTQEEWADLLAAGRAVLPADSEGLSPAPCAVDGVPGLALNADEDAAQTHGWDAVMFVED